MQIGFEVTAATPKRLRAAEDAPVAETMRGERKITQAPSTDQKKVRRQMQRKTANFEDPADIRAIASMPLNDFLASIGDDLTEIEVEAGIRDWWRARNTAFDPLKDSGLPGHEVSQEPVNSPLLASHCNSCQGSGQGFMGESCPRCAGTGKSNTRSPAFAIPEDQPQNVRPPAASPSKTVLPANQFGRSAALNDVGDCRLCEGPLIPKSRNGGTVKAECGDCGTEHSLQGSNIDKASARIEMFSNLSDFERERLNVLAVWSEPNIDCPKCGASDQKAVGWAGGSSGNRMQLVCPKCSHKYDEAVDSNWERQKSAPGSHGRSASKHLATVLSLVGSTWVPVTDTSPYLGVTGMSAIARRAQSVLDTEENS